MSLDAEALFSRFFLPLYPPGADLARLRREDANPAGNPRLVAAWEDAAERFSRLAPAALGEDPGLDGSDASVHRLGALLDRPRRDRWIEEGGEPLVQVTIHGAAYVARCVVRNHGGRHALRSPLWESRVLLSSRAGEAELAPFSWWLRALSDEEIGRVGLGERYRTLVEVPTFDPSALAPIAPADRRLPRLARVRYDLLVKHLRAHLPELRDVGRDFPSPERFAELGLSSLELRLLGGGRMLLLAGPGEAGAHLFWLDAGGFVKAAFYPWTGASRELALESHGDVLRVGVGGAAHELLWWGP